MSTTLFVASANSVPGDWLYGFKQLRQQITLAQAHTPEDHAQVAIQQLNGAVADLRAEVNDNHADKNVLQAIAVVHTATLAAQGAVAALANSPAGAQAQRDLAHAIANEQSTLQSLLSRVHWEVRVALTTQLGMVGVPVPNIRGVTITVTGNGQALAIITGAGFAVDAQVMVDGSPLGTVQVLTPTHVIVKIPTQTLTGGAHHIGVLNPDGTAAEYPLPAIDDSHGHGGNPHPQNTPGPTGSSSNGHGGTPVPAPVKGKGR